MLPSPWIALLLYAVSPVAAQEISLVRQEVAIKPGETRTFEFGTLPQQGTTILLEIVARVQTEKPSGSNYLMRLQLNGHDIAPARARGVLRLTNRPLVAPVAPNLPSAWFGNRAFRVLYASDFDCARKFKFYVGDPYITVLDVTDLSNPAAENRLTVTNLVQARQFPAGPPTGNLVIGRLVVRTKPVPSPTMTAADETKPFINRGELSAGPAAYRGEQLPGGGFRLTVGSRTWDFASEFSYPNAGINRLLPAAAIDRSGQPGWSFVVKTTAGGGEVIGEGPDYRLRRTIHFGPRKIHIADELTNRQRNQPLGLLVRHQVSLAGLTAPNIRLAGNPDPALNDYYSPHNPTVHVSLPGAGLGLVCEDDVLRNQAHLFCSDSPPAAGLRTEMLRLGPGQTYSVQWSVYPVAGPDYFDFINLVRQDWGANITVDGAWTFFSPDSILATPVETIRERFRRLGIRYACYCGGWVDGKHDRKRIGFGTGVMDDYWADFRGRLRAAAARIREAAPGTRVLVYYDTQRDTSEGPRERFRDSWLTDSRGAHLFTDWNGMYSRTYSMVATLDNSFGRAMLALAERYLDDMWVDGLYWDEMEAVAYGAPLVTYNQPDGYSCLLDPKKYTIQREIGLTTLLGEKHRLAVIDRVRKRGGVLMGNGPACTRALLDRGVPRMVEIQHNDHWCFEGNLGTPLGYMSSGTTFAYLTRALAMPCLPVGTRYDYSYDLPRRLFPFTPIALHHGYLLGRERIIALHSGAYGWPGERCLVKGSLYDRDGERLNVSLATAVAGEARTAVKLDAGQVAVLERLPVSLIPNPGGSSEKSTVLVTDVDYAFNRLDLRLTASQGAVLQIEDDLLLPIRQDQEYMVQIGDAAPRPAAAVEQGMLRVPLKACRDVAVKIWAR
jgi:hypothetical protein